MKTDYKLTFSGRFHYKKGGGLSPHGHPEDFQVQLIYQGKAIVGGGDSISAINSLKLTDKIYHISTGGGASLKLISGETLPGVEVISDK